MIFAALLLALAQDGNRFAYLDESDPYYPHRNFPKLVTPQWIGEEGVEAAIILGIDDMRGHEKWELYLRTILERLKQIDGRAPVSIMTCSIDPNHPHLQKWLKEGLSIEAHTVDHPCPLLKDGDLAKAKSTYDRCVDLMSLIPNNKPVAFRMPCCDSLNSPSPRFFAEIFNRTTPGGCFLTIDTSVFNLTTSADPDLPRDLVVDTDGRDKIRKYVPFPSFVNTIENYPYPYVIGRLCWEFPCGAPSDWEGFNLQKAGHPGTVADLKAMIDATVIKQGVFNFVFHPYNWIKPEQVVELIDHVVAKHGKKVKFLNFREAQERLDRRFGPLRKADGSDNGIRLLDADQDGLMDAVRISEDILPGAQHGRFAALRKVGVSFVTSQAAWHYEQGRWTRDTSLGGIASPATRFRDLDGDGICERIAADEVSRLDGGWKRLPFTLPAPLTDALRFVDLNGDGRLDLVSSNETGWGVWVFKDMAIGWEAVSTGKPGDPGAVPMITRNGTNNGAWFHTGHLWIQNEDTARMKDLVDRRSFEELLRKK